MTEPRLLHRIAQASSYALFGKLGAKLLGLGHYAVLFFSVLHADGYGQFAFILAYVGLFSGFAEGGVSSIFVRELNRTEGVEEKSRLFGAALVVLTVQAVIFWVVAVVGLLTFPTFRNLPESNLVLFYSTVILAAPFSAGEAVFKAALDMRVPVWSNLIRYGCFLVLILPGSPVDSLAEVLIAWWLLLMAGGAAVGILACRRLPPSASSLIRGVRSLLSESLPLFLTRFATVSYYRIDQVMLRMFFPDQSDQLAWYVSAVKLTEAANLVPAVLLEGVYPALTRLWTESRRAFDMAVRRVWTLFLGLAGLMVFGVTALLPFILAAGFLEELRPARTPLYLLTCTEGMIFLNLLLFQVLIAAGCQRRLVAVTTTMVSMNAVLNYFLFSTIFSTAGHVGASVSTLATECLGVALQIALVRNLMAGTFGKKEMGLLIGFVFGVCLLLLLCFGTTVADGYMSLLLGGSAVGWSVLCGWALRFDLRSLWSLLWTQEPNREI